ncbi:hypothetical protein CASFOL_010863 [Castilleja foliolosa]|uniref:F-box associated beta-propeller type 1 domain-containing protein n=1 Tax=Castilleja foliolosa TaxID=1961234 RepID=A0ABD3DTT0_9LAMI
MGPANKGIFYKVSESISKLRYNNKISNNSSFPGSLYIPKRLNHMNLNSDNKFLLRRCRLDRNANTLNERSNANYFSILSSDDNGSCFSLEKNYCLTKHRFDMDLFYSRIVGSCNGIVCLNDDDLSGNVVLWNPVTDELKSLPPSSIEARSMSIRASGFGFDARSEDYKVVRFVETCFSGYLTHHFELYSLKTDSWRPIVNPVSFRHPYGYQSFISSCSLNGSCYWEADNCVLCFDLVDEVFSDLPLPATSQDVSRCLVGIDGSTLGFIVFPLTYKKTFDLWVWKSKEQCWSQVDSFVLREVKALLGLWGDKCFFVGYMNEVLLFDLTTRELKNLGIEDHFPWTMSLVPFVESTVSIQGHSKVGELHTEE